jgi:hypothetical protein
MAAAALLIRWRRLLRMSVRTLVVLVLVIGCALGWLIQSARVQRDAVESIERSGGRVEYNHHESDTGEPWPPAWFVDLFGFHLCLPAIHVDLPNAASDRAMAAVSRLSQLRQLWLNETAITDEGMTNLRQLTALKELNLRQTKITDHGLINIKGLVGLEKLNLEDCNITDAGLAHLRALTKLSRLNVVDTHVSEKGVTELKRVLPNLKILREWSDVFNVSPDD